MVIHVYVILICGYLSGKINQIKSNQIKEEQKWYLIKMLLFLSQDSQ